MHGLVNRAIQRFVEDTYGLACWSDIVRKAGLGFDDFEAMLTYEDHWTEIVLQSASDVLRKTKSEILEDIGTYLVSDPNVEPLRRLLRFGGETYAEFLYSLDDLPDRARLALSDLELPKIEVVEVSDTTYRLVSIGNLPGFGHVVMGVLRAMADDYGVLAMLDHVSADSDTEVIEISLLESDFSEGRGFSLAEGLA